MLDLNISGASAICNNAETYTLIGNVPNNASISWSATPTNLVNISSTGSTAIINKLGEGVITLTATINNACGTNNILIQKMNIILGTPTQYGSIQNLNNPNQTNYCINSQDVTFTFIPSSSNSTVTDYYWGYYNSSSGNSNSPIQSAHSWDFYATILSSLSPGTYTVFARPENTCGAGNINLSYITLSNDGCNGEFSNKQKAVLEAEKITKISAFPNPAKTNITITVPTDSINLSRTIINVTDAMGRTIKTITTVNETNTISVSTWANGNYFITITDGKKRFIKKVIKQ